MVGEDNFGEEGEKDDVVDDFGPGDSRIPETFGKELASTLENVVDDDVAAAVEL